jgi:hypothetical protein
MSLFSETASSADTHEELQMELQTQFPRCPFHIDCIKDISELDTVFSTDKVILIYDDRLNQKYHNFYDMTVSEKNKLRHYTVVKSMGNKPITLRQVLNTMIKDSHFYQRLNDPRNKPEIAVDEIRQLFKKVSQKYGEILSKIS